MPTIPPGRARIVGRFGAVAAALGGAAWIGKAGAILVTGDQPPLLFEVAPLFFALALMGLRVLVGSRGGRLGDVGGWIAVAAVVLSMLDLTTGGSGPSSESDFSPLTFFAFLCVLASLILLGVPVLRRALVPGSARRLPLLLGVLTFPLIAVGAAFESISERLLEVPLLLVGVAWVWLGVGMWRAAARVQAAGGSEHVDRQHVVT